MKKLTGLFLMLMSLSTPLLAQRNSGGGEVAGCGMAGCMLVVWLLVMVAILGGAIALIVFIIKWIKKDATMRGMPNADSIKWLGLLGLLGLLIYLLQRPQGPMPPSSQPPPQNNQYGR